MLAELLNVFGIGDPLLTVAEFALVAVGIYGVYSYMNAKKA